MFLSFQLFFLSWQLRIFNNTAPIKTKCIFSYWGFVSLLFILKIFKSKLQTSWKKSLIVSASLPLCVCREVAQIDHFLQETAAREANAKVRLQQFIEELLDRADRAEKQLQIISSCGTTPNGSLGRCSLQASKGTGRQVGIYLQSDGLNTNNRMF